VLSRGRARAVWLQRPLRTKDWREANIRAKPALVEFDRILERARNISGPSQHRVELSEAEIQRLAVYHYASMLEADDELRSEGGSEELFQSVAKQLADVGIDARTSFQIGDPPRFGLLDREPFKRRETLRYVSPAANEALSRGNIDFASDVLDQLLDEFGLDLDDRSESFRKLGTGYCASMLPPCGRSWSVWKALLSKP